VPRTGVSNKRGGIPPDPPLAAAARALAAGDPLGALNRVALRDDAPALALRGIAMAQLGDLARARALVRRAARAFGPTDALARARCVVAEAEIALASRELAWPAKALDAARVTLESRGDRVNASYATLLQARRLLLLGRLQESERALAGMEVAALSPASRAVGELVTAGIAMRRLRGKVARAALARAAHAARAAGIPALAAEVESASLDLSAPAARLVAGGEERVLRLEEIEALVASSALVVDTGRRVVRSDGISAPFVRRPVLFAIARALAEAWPRDVPRDALVARAFGANRADASHRARLRVQVGRLRAAMRPLAGVRATRNGFALVPGRAGAVLVLAPPGEEEHATMLACLADGGMWSSSALASALGRSQRSLQRALDALAGAGKVQAVGRGRARRWIARPAPGIATAWLLSPPWPGDRGMT
jgi:hypothetical protein